MNLTWSRVLAIGVVAVIVPGLLEPVTFGDLDGHATDDSPARLRSAGWPTLGTAISMSREMDARFWLEKADADRDT